MINDKIQKQEGGDNSTNLQGQINNITNNYGLTYKDVKDIVLDIFNDNFIKLRNESAEIAKNRAEEFVNYYLEELRQKQPDSLNYMNDPGMQFAIYSAQKEYAKTGDKNLSNLLIDILVERASQQERNLQQIVLEECLSVIPKLTQNQLDTLSIIFIFRYSKKNNIRSIRDFENNLNNHIYHFVDSLSNENSLYQHLEYAGCASIGIAIKLENQLLNNYKGIFCNGFTKEAFEAKVGEFKKFSTILISCLNDSKKLQINAMDDNEFEEIINKNSFDSHRKLIEPFFKNYLMSENDIKKLIIEKCKNSSLLFDIWDNSYLKNMTLTSVGIAIAQANIIRKTKENIDLSIWIK